MTAGIDMGTAWLNVVPSFQGVRKSITEELEGAPVGQATRGWGLQIGLSISSGIGGALSAIGKVGLGAIGAGLAGITVGLASIAPEAIRASDATDKFKKTLQFAGVASEQIGSLTVAAQKYADQTVYDLGDIQSVTAKLAANGVEGFDKMAEAAGNLTAVAGGGKEEFAAFGNALVQINAAGRLQAQDWMQVANAIPGASGKLQEALKKNGAFVGDFKDAMSKGQISAEEFNKALLDLGFEEVAIEAAKTTTTFEGAWGNLNATLEKGFVSSLDKVKKPLTDIINALSEQFGPVFEAVSGKIEKLSPYLQKFADGLTSGKIQLADIAGYLAKAAAGFAALIAAGKGLKEFDSISGALSVFGDSSFFDALGKNLRGSERQLKAFRKNLPKALEGLKEDFALRAAYMGEAFGGIGPKIAAKFAPVTNAVSTHIGGATQALGSHLSTLTQTVGGKLSALGETIASKTTFIAEPLGNLSGKIKAGFAPVATAFEGLGGKIAGPLNASLGKVGGALQSFFAPGNFLKFFAFGALAAAAVAGIGALVADGGGALLSQIQDFVSNQLPQMVQSLMSFVQNQLPQFMQTGVQVVLMVIQGVTANLPALIQGAVGVITTLVSGLAAALPQLVPAAVQMITTLVAGLISALPQIIDAGLQLLTGLIQGIVSAIPILIAALPQVINGIVSALVQALPMIIDAGIQILNALIQGIITCIPQLIDMLPTIISTVVTTLITHLPQIIDAGIQLLIALINGLVDALPLLIDMLPQIITTIVVVLAQNAPRLVQAGIGALGHLISGIVSAIPQLLSAVGRIPGQILSALGNLGTMLIDSGKSLIMGFVNGILGAAKAAINAVGNVLSSVRKLFPFSPAKEGPFSGKGWVLYSGYSISEALAEGVAKKGNLFKDAVADTLAGGQEQIRDLEAAGINGSRKYSTAIAGNYPGNALPEYLIVRDVNDQLAGWMRVEAAGEVEGALAPVSRSRLRELAGI